MKLPSRLALSRHGIYYFRLQFQIDSKRFERRVSLQTRCPHIAKAKAIGISAMKAPDVPPTEDLSAVYGEVEEGGCCENGDEELKSNAYQYRLADSVYDGSSIYGLTYIQLRNRGYVNLSFADKSKFTNMCCSRIECPKLNNSNGCYGSLWGILVAGYGVWLLCYLLFLQYIKSQLMGSPTNSIIQKALLQTIEVECD